MSAPIQYVIDDEKVVKDLNAMSRILGLPPEKYIRECVENCLSRDIKLAKKVHDERRSATRA